MRESVCKMHSKSSRFLNQLKKLKKYSFQNHSCGFADLVKVFQTHFFVSECTEMSFAYLAENF